MGRLVLVDGNSIINRAFYAVFGRAPMTAPDGTPTGAVNGFFNSIFGVISEYNPDKVCVLFDLHAPTFRHKMSSEYKANRKGMPDELRAQMPVVKEILDLMGISRMELEGYEADDLIGTLSRLGEESGDEVFIFSGDHDDYQLISDKVSVIMPQSGKGKEPRLLIDRAKFEGDYGVKPEVFIHVKALMGDNSDNIKGVDKVGEKTAFKLIAQYGSVEGVLAHTGEMSAAMKAKFDAAHDLLDLNLKLCTIDRFVPVPYGIEKTKYNPDFAGNQPLFDRLNQLSLKSLIKKLSLDNMKSSNTVETLDVDSIEDPYKAEIIKVISEFVKSGVKVINTSEGDMIKSHIEKNRSDLPFVSIDFVNDKILITFIDEGLCFVTDENTLFDAFESFEGIIPVGYEYKDKSKVLSRPVTSFDKVFDPAVAGFVLNEIEGNKSDFERLFERVTTIGYPIEEEDKAKQITMDFLLEQTESSEDYKNDSLRNILILAVARLQHKEITDKKLEKLLYDIEFPLIVTLDAIERNGMNVSGEELNELHKEYSMRLEDLSARIYDLCGEEFNIGSPKQLSEILYGEDKLNLPHGKKGKTGVYSTGIEELNRLRLYHPVIDYIISYRELSKLDSTYAMGLIKTVDKDGRIRTTFTQAMTNTGRLSSTEPNLQNIPVRSEEGSRIRKTFVAPAGRVLVDADYSQIELRLLAAMSKDEYMCNAFNENEDIHKSTAMKIYNCSEEDVTSRMRATAKTVNFSIIYGVSEYGLSTDLGVNFKEASEIIKEYEAQFPGVMNFLNGLKALGEEKGYVETLFGRRRYLNELKSPNRNLRNFGLRAAMNTPIQGTAADIIKISMNKVYRALKKEVPDAKLVMQVHDELIVECAVSDKEKVMEILQSQMESAVKLNVPLVADAHAGNNWLEAK